MKAKILILSFTLSFILSGGMVLAQEDSSAPTEVILDEEVEAQDLEVGDPNFLPDNPFYFLKEWVRNIQSTLTFNVIAKAKLKEKFASEKLIELKKMVEQQKTKERVEKAIAKYQGAVEDVERATERIKERAEENEQVGIFLDKFIQHQALHQRVLQKLEEQVPAEVFEKIVEAREIHLEKFGEVMTKLETRENLQERLEKNLQELKGSKFKSFKNLEILKELEEKVPEEAKEAIKNAQENSLRTLQEQLEEMTQETRERFKEYAEEISGAKETHIEILEKLETELTPAIKEGIIQSRDRIMEMIKEKGQEQEQEQTGACIQLWDPVCGTNGKTYSNECFAQMAGVRVQYLGTCQNTSIRQMGE